MNLSVLDPSKLTAIDMPETAALQITALRHAYGAQTVLDVPELSLPQSAQMLVLGPSGSGKSTLLHAIGAPRDRFNVEKNVAARYDSKVGPIEELMS